MFNYIFNRYNIDKNKTNKLNIKFIIYICLLFFVGLSLLSYYSEIYQNS